MADNKNRPSWQGGPPDWLFWLPTIIHGITIVLHLVVIYIEWTR